MSMISRYPDQDRLPSGSGSGDESRADGPGDPQPKRVAEFPKQPQAREKLARRSSGQVNAADRVARGLCLQVGEYFEGEGTVLLGAMHSGALWGSVN